MTRTILAMVNLMSVTYELRATPGAFGFSGLAAFVADLFSDGPAPRSGSKVASRLLESGQRSLASIIRLRKRIETWPPDEAPGDLDDTIAELDKLANEVAAERDEAQRMADSLRPLLAHSRVKTQALNDAIGRMIDILDEWLSEASEARWALVALRAERQPDPEYSATASTPEELRALLDSFKRAE
jgi:hypothetical protein